MRCVVAKRRPLVTRPQLRTTFYVSPCAVAVGWSGTPWQRQDRFGRQRHGRNCFAQSPVWPHRRQSPLRACGLELQHLVRQTANRREFIGALPPDNSRSGFPAAHT